MKAKLEHIRIKDHRSSFVCYWNIGPEYPFEWHYHPEYELTYIEKSRGRRLVGDQMEPYQEGDLVLLGPNLPHTWISEGFTGDNRALVVQFTESIFDFDLVEMGDIRELLDRSRRGVFFHPPFAMQIGKAMKEMDRLTGFPKLMMLYQILEELAQSWDFEQIASVFYEPVLGLRNEERLDTVCGYLHQHFSKDIPLEKMATLANMTKTSFCRFFKKMTGQTFTGYLNELRVGHACRLLIESRKTVSEIAYASGFSSSTHFNRIFYREKKQSPTDYRKRFG